MADMTQQSQQKAQADIEDILALKPDQPEYEDYFKKIGEVTEK